MTKITVETATLSDAVSKAARVAPNKGAAFDKAAGVFIEIDPIKTTKHIYVKATDLDTTYLQRVPVLLIEGEDDLWRFPSQLVAGVISNLPLGIGSEVTLERTGPSEVTVKCGRKRAKIRLYDADDFPTVAPFDPTGMAKVEMFPTRLNQAAWATDPESAILSGVHIDGDSLIACDRTRLVVVPCKVPVVEPITVPLSSIAPVIRNAGTIEVRATDTRLQMMPDVDTQITCLILAATYPNVKGIMRTSFDGKIDVDREMLLDSLNRMMVMVKTDRYPKVVLTIHKDYIGLYLGESESGEMFDELDAEGGPLPDSPQELVIMFTPSTLINALTASTRASVTIEYGGTAGSSTWTPDKLPIHMYDEGGFDAWLMPVSA